MIATPEEDPPSLFAERQLPDLVALREKVVRLAFVYVTLFALVPFCLALYRSIGHGVTWYFWIQSVCYCTLAGGCLFSKRIPSRVASYVIVWVILALGIAGIAAWGPAPSRFVILCFACLFTAIFHGSAASLRFVALTSLCIGIVAVFHDQFEMLTGGDSVAEHTVQQWLVTLLSFSLYTTIGCLLVGWVMQTLQKSIVALSQREEALQSANTLLQGQAVQLEEQAVELEEQAQVLMAQRDQAEQAAEAKDRFLSVISHELRTPLNPILGFLEVIAENPSINPEARNQIDLMQRSSQQLLRMIERLVDYSELDRGEIAIQKGKIGCDELKRELENRYRDDARERRLAFEASCDCQTHELLELDRRRLFQVIDELAANALKFTERGSVAIRFTLGDQRNAAARLRIRVSDTGVGIEADRIASLFDPFNQADASRTRAANGLGLGLATCHAIVKAMGGDVAATSRCGEGTTFTVELPVGLSQAPAFNGADRRSRSSFDTPLRVLVAEDDLVNQKVVQALLRRMGATSTCVDNGRQAVETLRQKDFDIVLMDVSMPIMDGISATREIRSCERVAQTPIVALTAHSYAKSEAACFDAGMDAFLTKPIKSSALYETIASVLAGRASTHTPDCASPV